MVGKTSELIEKIYSEALELIGEPLASPCKKNEFFATVVSVVLVPGRYYLKFGIVPGWLNIPVIDCTTHMNYESFEEYQGNSMRVGKNLLDNNPAGLQMKLI